MSFNFLIFILLISSCGLKTKPQAKSKQTFKEPEVEYIKEYKEIPK